MPTDERIEKTKAQKNLTFIWMSFTAALTLLFFVQTVIGNKFADQTNEAWNWFIPNVFPTLTLMIGALVAASRASKRRDSKVNVRYYHLTRAVILFYLVVLTLIVLAMPFAFQNYEVPALEYLRKTSLMLSALQGITTLTLGIFFIQEAEGE